MRPLAAALATALVPALPWAAQARPVDLAATKLTRNAAAAAVQCNMGFGVRKAKTDKHDALELMAGRADLDEYGWFRLAANPSWKPVATLDSSGKGHMHSLHYLLPLLRYGVRSGDTAMVDRFYFLIRDWLHDNPPGGSTSRYAWGPPIYEGFRAQVLVCAAAGPRGGQQWLLRGLVRHGQMMSDPRRYEGVNNASLHQSMGLYALGETMKRPKWRATAISREASLAVKLIQPDGSDEEGALEYAVNDYRWFGQAAERLRRGGDAGAGRADALHGDAVLHRPGDPPGRQDRGARRHHAGRAGRRRAGPARPPSSRPPAVRPVSRRRRRSRPTRAATSSAGPAGARRARWPTRPSTACAAGGRRRTPTTTRVR